jgi:integrase
MVPRPGTELASDRALSDDEILAVWRALDASDNLLMAGILKLRLLTGQRTREVARMRWQDIDGELWQLPKDFAKNGRAHRIPLGPLALEALRSLQPITGTERWVFASPRRRGAPIVQIRRFVVEIVKESNRVSPSSLAISGGPSPRA